MARRRSTASAGRANKTSRRRSSAAPAGKARPRANSLPIVNEQRRVIDCVLISPAKTPKRRISRPADTSDEPPDVESMIPAKRRRTMSSAQASSSQPATRPFRRGTPSRARFMEASQSTVSPSRPPRQSRRKSPAKRAVPQEPTPEVEAVSQVVFPSQPEPAVPREPPIQYDSEADAEGEVDPAYQSDLAAQTEPSSSSSAPPPKRTRLSESVPPELLAPPEEHRPRTVLRIARPPLFHPLEQGTPETIDDQLLVRRRPTGSPGLSSPASFSGPGGSDAILLAPPLTHDVSSGRESTPDLGGIEDMERRVLAQPRREEEPARVVVERVEDTPDLGGIEDMEQRVLAEPRRVEEPAQVVERMEEPAASASTPAPSSGSQGKGKGRAEPLLPLRAPSGRIRIPTEKVLQEAPARRRSEPGPSRRSKRRRTEGGVPSTSGERSAPAEQWGAREEADFQMMDMAEVAALPWVPAHGSVAGDEPEAGDSSIYVPPGVQSLIDSMKNALEIESRARQRAEERYTEEIKRRVAVEEQLAAERRAWRQERESVVPKSPTPERDPAPEPPQDADMRTPPPAQETDNPESEAQGAASQGDGGVEVTTAPYESPSKSPFVNQFWSVTESLNRLLPARSTTPGPKA